MRARKAQSKSGGYSGYTIAKHLCKPYVSRGGAVATYLVFSGYRVATVATPRACHPLERNL